MVARSSAAGGRPRGVGAWPGPSALLERYGVLTRETAALDPWAPPWRDLAPWLARAELRGEVRRGYFVEGLSGVQYADRRGRRGAGPAGRGPAEARPTPVLLSTLDPANLYGSGAPLDIPLLEGGTARLSRIVVELSRPDRRPAGADHRGVRQAADRAWPRPRRPSCRPAIALLPDAGRARRGGCSRSRRTTTAATLASPAAPWLAEAGFVRDHPGMAFYAGW